MFLEKNFTEFCDWYWKKEDLFWHPLSKMCPQMMIVGNPYCCCLFPKEDTIQKIVEKAGKIGIKISFQIPPVSQSLFADMTKIVDYIADLAEERNEMITIYVGDFGMKNYIMRKHERNLTWKAGVLLKKGIRDPRLKYRISSESDERLLEVQQIEGGICLPYYQCNTGTFCPLYSLCRYGKRDAYERVIACPGYCEDHFLIYPEHLQLIGKYNSIFGWNDKLLSNGHYFDGKKDWVVMNL